MTLPCEHCHHVPTYKHTEALQQPYRGMWQALVAWEQEINADGLPTPLRAALHRIADEQPDAVAAFAVNTTRTGRDLDEVTREGL